MPVMHFVHPETKGRARVRVPAQDAQRVAALFTAQGYRRVSSEDYQRFVKRYPLTALDAAAAREYDNHAPNG